MSGDRKDQALGDAPKVDAPGPDPQSAWPFPVTEDLGGGEVLDKVTELEAQNLFDEAEARRSYRRWALIAALVVLAALVIAMGCVISAFVAQVKAGPKVVAEKVLDAAIPASRPLPGLAASTAVPPTPRVAIPAVATSAAASVAAISPPHAEGAANGQPKWIASVSIDATSIANSVVAIASVLVVAVVVLAIALVKASFGLESPGSLKAETPKKPDDGLAIPGVEIIKALGEILSSTAKAVAGGSDKKS